MTGMNEEYKDDVDYVDPFTDDDDCGWDGETPECVWMGAEECEVWCPYRAYLNEQIEGIEDGDD